MRLPIHTDSDTDSELAGNVVVAQTPPQSAVPMSRERDVTRAQQPAMQPGRRLALWGNRYQLVTGAAVFFLVALLVYGPVLSAGFIWDDDDHLTQNACIVGPLGFAGIWTTSAAVYYPLVLTSFWVQHALWGLNPMPYHLVNVFMHAACAVVLWRVLRRLGVPAAWFGALLWAVHPVMVESVAWITELKNTQSGLFYLVALLLFLKWRTADPTTPGREWRYAGALVCAVLAILSKASTVMLPVVLGLCWWWLDGTWRWRNVSRLAPFFLISIAASGWTIWEQKFHSGAVGPEWTQTWLERFVIAGKAIWFYLGKLAWPHPLVFIYPRWEISAEHGADFVPLGAAILVGLLLWSVARVRGAFLAYAVFVVSLFPVLGFFDIYFFRFSFVADHFQYLASMAVLPFAAAGVAWGLQQARLWGRWGGNAGCAVLVTLLGLLSWRQAHIYRSEETLWRATLAGNPGCWMAHNNRGLACAANGQAQEAMAHYREALRLKPDFTDACINLGVVYKALGRTAEAREQFVRALVIAPLDAEAHNNLGVLLMEAGEDDNALAHYEIARQADPRNASAWYNQGNIFARQGRREEAIAAYRRALQLVPSNAPALNNLACLLAEKQQFDEAVACLRTAHQLRPGHAETLNNLGSVLSQQGRAGEALDEFQKAIKLKPDFLEARMNLAGAMVAVRRNAEAREEYAGVLRLSPGHAGAHYALGNLWYRAGDRAKAAEHYRATLVADSHHAEANYQLAVLLAANHAAAEAITHFRAALRGKPDWIEALNNLAWQLATHGDAELRNGPEAVALATRAVRLTQRRDAELLDTLAVAQAETGRWSDAIETAKQGAALAVASGNQTLAEAIQARIRLYESQRPFRE